MLVKKTPSFSIYILMLIGLLLFCTISCKNKDSNSDTIYFNPSITYGTMTDQDGNTYKTVTIGSQTWMAENLKVIKFRNGDAIPNVSSLIGDSITSAAYCNYDNNPDNSTHGRLYNWYAATDSPNVCPYGWHIPSDSEWTTLINYLGEEVAGGKMKEAGLTHWSSPNTGADNSSGFTAIPLGARYGQDLYFGLGMSTGYWSSTEVDSTDAWHRSLSSNYEKVGRYFSKKSFGISVRCIKD